MQKILHGIMHGKTIELKEDHDWPDGQEVTIVLQARPAKPGDGLRRCAGALADEWTEEDDRILHELYLDRKRDTRGDIPE